MIDLAISVDTDENGTAIIETNHGRRLKSWRWPQDSDFQLVAFNPEAKGCEVIWAEELARDIESAIVAIDQAGILKGNKPDWYHRLSHCGKRAQ